MLSGPSESVLTKDHAQQLIAALPEHFADLTLFSLSTELRSANAARITWPQINLERRFAWERGSTAGVDRRAVAHRRGPGGRARPVAAGRAARKRSLAAPRHFASPFAASTTARMLAAAAFSLRPT